MSSGQMIIRRFPKTILLVFTIITYFYLLPLTLTLASLYYFKDWQVNAEKSAAQIAGGKPYCIIVPLIDSPWYIPGNFEQMDIKRIIAKEVDWKLKHLDFSLGENSDTLGFREVHFGILFDKKLYYWSFMKQAFFDARAHGYADATYRNLKQITVFLSQGKGRKASKNNSSDVHSKRNFDNWIKGIKKNHPDLSLEDFLCPHI
jgi:hypothetical protein